MSVYGGTIDFRTTNNVEYVEWPQTAYAKKATAPTKIGDCLLQEQNRDNITLEQTTDTTEKYDFLCPSKKEYYMDVLKRNAVECTQIHKIVQQERPIDEKCIEDYQKNIKKTLYMSDYCQDGEPYHPRKLVLRNRNEPLVKLPDGHKLPETSYQASFRRVGVADRSTSFKPKNDRDIQKKVSEITQDKTDFSTYHENYGLLGQAILESNPYGPAREEPYRSRWKARGVNYTWLINN